VQVHGASCMCPIGVDGCEACTCTNLGRPAWACHWSWTTTSPARTPEIHKWLWLHTCFQLHFTPTSSYNLVERWSGDQDVTDCFGFLTYRHVPSRVGGLSVVGDVIVEPTIERLQTWLSRGG
jgi:hypothetical protein